MIDNLNPDLRVTKNRESFIMSPEEAYDLLEAIAVISGSQDKLKRVNKEKESKTSQTIRRPAINFYECGLKDGDKLVCTEDPSIVVTVKGEHKVLFADELTSLTAIIGNLRLEDFIGNMYKR